MKLASLSQDEILATIAIWNRQLNEDQTSDKLKNVFAKLQQRNVFLHDVLVNNLWAIMQQDQEKLAKGVGIGLGFLLDLWIRHEELVMLEESAV